MTETPGFIEIITLTPLITGCTSIEGGQIPNYAILLGRIPKMNEDTSQRRPKGKL